MVLIKSIWNESEKGEVEEGIAIEVLKKTNGLWVFIIDNPYGV